MIGSLLYLIVSRLDVMFSVCLCARFQACPKESHLTNVKRIFRYLIATQNLSLWYPKKTSFDLVGFCNVDYAGSKINRKNTSGTCQFLGHMFVSCLTKSKTQWLSPLLKLNILPLVVVVLKFFGLNSN